MRSKNSWSGLARHMQCRESSANFQAIFSGFYGHFREPHLSQRLRKCVGRIANRAGMLSCPAKRDEATGTSPSPSRATFYFFIFYFRRKGADTEDQAHHSIACRRRSPRSGYRVAAASSQIVANLRTRMGQNCADGIHGHTSTSTHADVETSSTREVLVAAVQRDRSLVGSGEPILLCF
jgi:hypothetical protein